MDKAKIYDRQPTGGTTTIPSFWGHKEILLMTRGHRLARAGVFPSLAHSDRSD